MPATQQVILLLAFLAWIASSYAFGYRNGYQSGKEAEREEMRAYVNENMKAAGFCEWIKHSRIV